MTAKGRGSRGGDSAGQGGVPAVSLAASRSFLNYIRDRGGNGNQNVPSATETQAPILARVTLSA